MAASVFQFVQRPIALTNLLPLCAVVGGMLGVIWEYARDPKAGFPSVPSFRGALLEALFAFCFVIFGLGIFGTTHALSAAGLSHRRNWLAFRYGVAMSRPLFSSRFGRGTIDEHTQNQIANQKIWRR